MKSKIVVAVIIALTGASGMGQQAANDSSNGANILRPGSRNSQMTLTNITSQTLDVTFSYQDCSASGKDTDQLTTTPLVIPPGHTGETRLQAYDCAGNQLPDFQGYNWHSCPAPLWPIDQTTGSYPLYSDWGDTVVCSAQIPQFWAIPQQY